MEKKLINRLVLVGMGLLVLSVVVTIIGAIQKKNQKERCAETGGAWDKKAKICVPPKTESTSSTSSGTSSPPSTTSPTPSWNPHPLSVEIKKNIEGINGFFYEETAEKILSLPDSKLKTLYNHYNAHHAKEYPTLTKLFAAEWDGYWFSLSPYDRVVNRFKSLGLY